MKKKIASLLLVGALIVPAAANASFLRDMVNQFGFRFSLSANDTLNLFGALADDIGDMADRILVMADNIDGMADKILVMSDKIVKTEEIMAGMAVDLAEIKANTSSNTSTLPTLIISSENGDTLSDGQAPVLISNYSYPDYLVYVSSTVSLSATTTAILIHNNHELQERWSEFESLSVDGKIYISLRMIDGSDVSDLSNVLTYNTTY